MKRAVFFIMVIFLLTGCLNRGESVKSEDIGEDGMAKSATGEELEIMHNYKGESNFVPSRIELDSLLWAQDVERFFAGKKVVKYEEIVIGHEDKEDERHMFYGPYSYGNMAILLDEQLPFMEFRSNKFDSNVIIFNHNYPFVTGIYNYEVDKMGEKLYYFKGYFLEKHEEKPMVYSRVFITIRLSIISENEVSLVFMDRSGLYSEKYFSLEKK